MYKYLPIILLLTACIPEIEPVQLPVQITFYTCSSDGFQYTLDVPPEPIVDEFGNQLTCITE